MSWGLRLIASMLTDESPSEAMRVLLHGGVDEKYFPGAMERAVWEYILRYYNRPHRHGRVPGYSHIQERFPKVELPEVDEDVEDLLEHARLQTVRRLLDTAVDAYDTCEIEDTYKSIDMLEAACRQARGQMAEGNNDVVWRDQAREDLEKHLAAVRDEENGGLTGLPWPWALLNEATRGIQDGEMIMIWARPKQKKTWIGLYIAAYLFNLGYKVLIYSKEMMWKQIHLRVLAILAELDYDKVKNGDLTPKEEALLREVVDRTTADDFPGDLIFTDLDKPDGSLGDAQMMRSKLDQNKPDFALLDSAYLMDPGAGLQANDWKAYDAITRQAKAVFKSTKIPGLVIMQEDQNKAVANRKLDVTGRNSMSGYGNMTMHPDLGIRLVSDPLTNKTTLWFPVAREMTLPYITIHSVPASNFRFTGDPKERITLAESLEAEAEFYSQQIGETPEERNQREEDREKVEKVRERAQRKGSAYLTRFSSGDEDIGSKWSDEDGEEGATT